MKLSKKVEDKILKVYNSYWDCYLDGDVVSIASLLDKQYTQLNIILTRTYAS